VGLSKIERKSEREIQERERERVRERESCGIEQDFFLELLYLRNTLCPLPHGEFIDSY
jgi:hypothetical protein